MTLLFDILKTLLVFVVSWLALWLVAFLLISIPTSPTIWLGQILDTAAPAFAALVAILWFVGRSASWK